MAGLLTQSGFEVHPRATGIEGVHAVRETNPVLVTVDVGLPDIDGYEVTRRIRRFSGAYVVMLTARDDEVDTLMGLDQGADDYLTKPFRPRELRARIEAMLRRPRCGVPAVPPPVDGQAVLPVGTFPRPVVAPAAIPPPADGGLELAGLVIAPAVHQVTVNGRDVTVTPTEFVILETLLRGGRIVRSKADLFRICRGESLTSGTFVSEADERTIEVHVGNLRRKLGDDPRRPRWIETVRGVGYRAMGVARANGLAR